MAKKARRDFFDKLSPGLPPRAFAVPVLFSVCRDLSGLFERELRHGRADKLIDERAAEDDRTDLRGKMRHDLTGCQRQTDGHTGLRQQARAKVLFHVLVTLAHDAAKRSAEGLAGHSQHDVDHADEADPPEKAPLRSSPVVNENEVTDDGTEHDE